MVKNLTSKLDLSNLAAELMKQQQCRPSCIIDEDRVTRLNSLYRIPLCQSCESVQMWYVFPFNSNTSKIALQLEIIPLRLHK